MNAKPQTKPKHTPEPWRFDTIVQSGAIRIAGPNNETIAVMHMGNGRAGNTASRTVACVNACAGLDPAALPALIAAAEWVIADTYHDSIVSEEAEAALRAALAAVRGTP